MRGKDKEQLLCLQHDQGPLPVHLQIGYRMRSIVLNSVTDVHSPHANVRSAILNNSQCLSFSGRSHANRIPG